jgi:2-hydroxyacyl-CoA lyase 1
MGVGLGYVIAAFAAYNLPSSGDAVGNQKPKKIVALEGDSAFGFSGMEVETLARHRIPALIFVMNNSGIYRGDTMTKDAWRVLQDETTSNQTKSDETVKKGLRSTSLLYETRYEHLATMCGGNGFFVRTEQELEQATQAGFLENERVTVVNVIVEPGLGQSLQFGWQGAKGKGKDDAKL